jgi:hypothetical protein
MKRLVMESCKCDKLENMAKKNLPVDGIFPYLPFKKKAS